MSDSLLEKICNDSEGWIIGRRYNDKMIRREVTRKGIAKKQQKCNITYYPVF